jgi:hypothetical protein
MPIVAVVALAVVVIETNKCHKGTKQGKHQVNNHRLKTQQIHQPINVKQNHKETPGNSNKIKHGLRGHKHKFLIDVR